MIAQELELVSPKLNYWNDLQLKIEIDDTANAVSSKEMRYQVSKHLVPLSESCWSITRNHRKSIEALEV